MRQKNRTVQPVALRQEQESARRCRALEVGGKVKYCSAKDVDILVRGLVQQGWHYSKRGKHARLTAPRGWPFVTIPCSPSDYRALLNLRSDLRRAGLARDVALS